MHTNKEAIIKEVTAADVAIAAWLDATHPDGQDLLLIKGEAVLQRIVSNGKDEEKKVAVIPVKDINEAFEVLLLVAN